MTAENTIANYRLGLKYTSKNNKNYKRGEATATKVWRTLNEIEKETPDFWKKFVLWNAFAFNIHTGENKNRWFETPRPEELESNIELLETFLNLYPNAKIVAVGKSAKKALKDLKIEREFECVKHPSNDKNNDFSRSIQKIINKEKV